MPLIFSSGDLVWRPVGRVLIPPDIVSQKQDTDPQMQNNPDEYQPDDSNAKQACREAGGSQERKPAGRASRSLYPLQILNLDPDVSTCRWICAKKLCLLLPSLPL